MYAATDKRDGQAVTLEIANRLKLATTDEIASFFDRARIIVSFETPGIRNPKEFGVTEGNRLEERTLNRRTRGGFPNDLPLDEH